MVKNFVIYKFEKVKVAEVAVDTSVKGWLDEVLKVQGLMPAHLKNVVTHGAYGQETGNFYLADPTYSPEMPLFYVEKKTPCQSDMSLRDVARATDQRVRKLPRPSWTWPKKSQWVWSEDDAGCDDRETLDAAYERLFKMKMPTSIEEWDGGDAAFKLMPDGQVVIASYPGNSCIRLLFKKAELFASKASSGEPST